MVENSSKIAEDVKKLLELIHCREKGVVSPVFQLPKLSHPESKHIAIRYIVAPFAAILALLVARWLFVPSDILKLIVVLLLLVGYVGIISVQLLELYHERGSITQILKNPLAVYTESLVEDPRHDVEFVQSLQSFCTNALRLVKARLQVDQNAISHRLGVTVGALDKVGVIPGLVSLYLAASAKGPQKFAVIFAVAMFAVFVFVYAIQHSLPRLRLYISFIEYELERRKDEL